MSLCRHNYVVDEQHPGHECCQNCGHVRPVFHNQDNISLGVAGQSTSQALDDTQRLNLLIDSGFSVKRLKDTGQFILIETDGYPVTGSEFDTPRQAIDELVENMTG